eukprot:3335369-Amphidinium_carterae.1
MAIVSLKHAFSPQSVAAMGDSSCIHDSRTQRQEYLAGLHRLRSLDMLLPTEKTRRCWHLHSASPQRQVC